MYAFGHVTRGTWPKLLATLRELGARPWVAGALEGTVALLPTGDAEEAAVEAERGRCASSDEALRWALAALRGRHGRP